jgi:hypothetical protein
MLIVMAAIPAQKIVAVLIGLLLKFDSRQQDAESPVRSRNITHITSQRRRFDEAQESLNKRPSSGAM